MKTYLTFDGGPIYVDLNIGESVEAPGGREAKLIDIGYQGPVGKPGRAEFGWAKVVIDDLAVDIPLGWWRTVGGVRVAAELNGVYNTDPVRKRWELDYWRLEHDARLMLSDGLRPITPAGRYAFPVVSDGWSWGYGHNWLSKYTFMFGLNPTHYGIDIDCPVGVATVRASIGGRIVYIGGYKEHDEIGSPGIVVTVLGDDGLGYLYCHMSALESGMEEGARIETRQPIGTNGISGAENVNCTPHTHFEVIWGESPEALLHPLRPPWCDESHKTLAFVVNPLPYLYQWFEEWLAVEDV